MQQIGTRVEQGTPVKKANGKWACTFKMIRTGNGPEYVAGELETSGLWFDAQAAMVAGRRAIEVMLQTERFPNLCDIW